MKRFILTYIALLLSITGIAQLYNSGATLAIEENAFVSSLMNIENHGNIINKGIIYLSGDWLNYNLYDTNGTLVLNGENTQTIEHNNQDFKILILDGSGEKALNSNANITAELSLKNGILTVYDGFNLILKENAISSNSSQSSFVNGLLYNTGTGYKFYPIGKDNRYSPVELTNIEDYSVVGFEAFSPNLNTGAESGLTVSDDRYFQQTYLEGFNTNSKITLPYDNNYNATDFDSLVVVQADDSELYQSIGNDLSGGISVTGVTSSEPATKRFYSLALIGKIDVSMFIPSAFSPNAPNEEDRVIKIYGGDFSEDGFSFMIFNKWGNLIFSTNSLSFMINTGWDGKNMKNGKKEPSGMYSYIMKVRDNNGNKLEKTGTIMIIN